MVKKVARKTTKTKEQTPQESDALKEKREPEVEKTPFSDIDPQSLRIVWDIGIMGSGGYLARVKGLGDIPMGLYPPFFTSTLQKLDRDLKDITAPVYNRIHELFNQMREELEDVGDEGGAEVPKDIEDEPEDEVDLELESFLTDTPEDLEESQDDLD